MGEVKRYAEFVVNYRHGGNPEADMRESENGRYVLHSDYARLERERDELASEAARIEQAVREHIAGMQVKIDMQNAELTCLRAVDESMRAAFASFTTFIDRMPTTMLARIKFSKEWSALAEACGRKG